MKKLSLGLVLGFMLVATLGMTGGYQYLKVYDDKSIQQAVNFTAAVQFYGADLQATLYGKQATISAVGMVKGAGYGSTSAAAPGVDYVAPSTTVNNHPLSSNVVVTAFDVGAMPILTGMPQGAIYYFNGTAWDYLLPGPAGYFLKTNGIFQNPSWSLPTSDTSDTGTNWTSTSVAPTQRAVSELAGNIGNQTFAWNLAPGDNGRFSAAVFQNGELSDWTLQNDLSDSFGLRPLTNHSMTFISDSSFPLGTREVGVCNGTGYASFSNANMPTSTAMSWTGWIKTSDAGSWLHDFINNNNRAEFFLNSGKLYFEFALPGEAAVYDGGGTITVNTGSWVHFAFVYNGATSLKIYVNGALDTEVTLPGPLLMYSSTTGNIGRGTNGIFNGSVSEMGIWNRALTSTDITSLYAGNHAAITAQYDKNAYRWDQLCAANVNLTLGSYVMLPQDVGTTIVFPNTLTGTSSLTLISPPAPPAPPVRVKNESSYTVTISGSVNNTSSFTLLAGQSSTLISDGSTWHIEAGAGGVSGPGSATSGNLVTFADSSGNVLANGPALGSAANNVVQRDGSGYFPSVNTAPSATGGAKLNIPAGVAPSAPNAGDLWYDGTHLYFYNSIPHDLLAAGSGSTSDTSYNGSNWTSTTSSPSQRAVAEQISATPASSLSAGNSGAPVCGTYSNTTHGIDSYTVLCMHLDSSLTDSSASAHTVTNSNVTWDTTNKEFGTASASFNGTSSVLTSADSADWAFGSGDFTIDWWMINTADSGRMQAIITQAGDGGTNMSWGIYTYSDTDIRVYYSTDGSSGPYLNFSSVFPNSASFVHWALVRNGTSAMLFKNGTQVGGTQTLSGSLYDSTYSLKIGSYSGSGNLWFKGNLDEPRISKGIARWTSNFTPPTSAYAGGTIVQKFDISASQPAQNLGSRTVTAPAIAAGTGAGTSPTIAIAGSDSSFQITLTTGSAPAGTNAAIATVTFASAFPNTPYSSVTPSNANAATLSGTTGVYEVTGTSNFVLYSGSAALTGATQYIWNVHTF